MSLYSFEEICGMKNGKCENAVWHDCPDCYSKPVFCHCEIHAEEQASNIHGRCNSFRRKMPHRIVGDEVHGGPIANQQEIGSSMLKSKVFGTNQQEIERRNRKYLRLNAEQYKIHKKLMATNMDVWPEILKKYLSKNHGKDMFCGDALMCWVADWIRKSKT
jgi:hypothetical protein